MKGGFISNTKHIGRSVDKSMDCHLKSEAQKSKTNEKTYNFTNFLMVSLTNKFYKNYNNIFIISPLIVHRISSPLCQYITKPINKC